MNNDKLFEEAENFLNNINDNSKNWKVFSCSDVLGLNVIWPNSGKPKLFNLFIYDNNISFEFPLFDII